MTNLNRWKMSKEAKQFLKEIGVFNTIFLARNKDTNTMAKIIQKYADQQLILSGVSHRRELLLGFQKSEYFDLYEQGVLEYKDAIEKYLA
jgi:hypothetical protein